LANIKELDPGASPLHYFGAELRRLREQAELTLSQLGKVVFCTGSLIGQIETAAKAPSLEFIQRADAALGAEGALLRLWPLLKRSRLPYKQRRVAEIESPATQILAFQPQVVHGLLQTEGYARAVLRLSQHHDLEQELAARVHRQRILNRADAPLLWVVLSEAVLYQQVGGRHVMAEQLLHLLEYRDVAHVHVQVLPFAAGAHPGMLGAFTLFTYEDQPNIAYAEGYDGVDATANPTEYKARSLRYDLLRASALSPGDSADLIARVLEERYEHQPAATSDLPLA
jgi:transcriptional regulator with XRE-family HTH domain